MLHEAQLFSLHSICKFWDGQLHKEAHFSSAPNISNLSMTQNLVT